MAYSKAQGKATLKWKKENIKRVELNLNKENDADIIEYFDSIDNVQGEVKRLVRARMKNEVFTNHEVNVIKTALDIRINELTDYVEEAEQVIRECEETLEKTPIDAVKERLTKRIGKYTADIEKWKKEIADNKEVRERISK